MRKIKSIDKDKSDFGPP